MKKLSILFVSVLTLGLAVTSCSSDDDKEGTLEGKWELTEVGAVLAGQEILQPATNEGCANDVVEFKADGNFVDSYSEFTDDKCKAYTQEGKWVKDGSSLSKTYGTNNTEKYEVAELTGNKLKLKETYTESGITVSAVLVFKKI
ncbi:lipocalin family protein [Flavobacterium sp. KACC 22758]|uniref:lipocalin family protein n=1 Tax=Flavobacterium sp. KACC 22758 TaxID=3025667 RepID=UPI002366020D|nr:lipocalin family protein [Flavobacterium sp. KACC 22758]WDF60349.1 lipocalin family protein [Flavobacterium sp. KACC 22758]